MSQVWDNWKCARQRVKYGFCNRDVWNLNDWMLDVLPQMFRKLANEGCAYPGVEPFEIPEKWHEWLYSLAKRLESCTEDMQDTHNEFYKSFMDTVLDKEQNKQIVERYYERAKEIYDESCVTIKECFAEIGEHFWHLWD